MHHSNAGGIYTAKERGADVVVKEARPHTGVTADGRDAIERSNDEADARTALAHIPHVTRLLRRFQVHGHHYLVLEKAPGVPLHQAVVARHPLISANASAGDVSDYRTWAERLIGQIRGAVLSVHAAGMTHGDVHPGNFLVDDDGAVTLIDFEMARPVAEDAPPVIGAPGFVPPAKLRGIQADLFALRRIEVFVYAPLAPLLDLHESKDMQIDAWVSERFHPQGEPSSSTAVSTDLAKVTEEELTSQLLADATPERADRLWPGDPSQFDEPGYGLAHGALGPLLALWTAGHHVPQQLEDWAERSCRNSEQRSGLMDGLDGAAAAFNEFGRLDLADALLDRALEAPLRWNAPGVYSGPTGAALAWLRMSDRHPELISRARTVFDELADRAGGWETRSSEPVGTGLSGLLRGPSGQALLALRLFDLTGEHSLLNLADAAIRSDLARCVKGADDALLLNEGWRLMPYLGSGSTGVAIAVAELLRRRPTTELSGTLRPLQRAAAPEFVLEPGLEQGRSGLMLALAAVQDVADTNTDEVLARHRTMTHLHAVPRPRGTGIPGRGLLRLSCDLFTGSAGVLWTWAALRTGTRTTLPFIDLPPVEPPHERAAPPGGGETYGFPALFAEPRAHRS